MTDTLDQLLSPQPEAARTRKRLSAGTIFLLIGFVVFGAVIALQLFQQSAPQPTDGSAPDFEFETFDGAAHRLSDFRGKVVVLNFWASWCPPCREEAPELQSAWEHYRPSDKVVFLGIAYADNGVRSMAYLDEYKIDYLNAPDLGTRISDLYGIRGVPETFVIDQNGSVAKFILAGVTEAQLREVIDPLLGERS